MRVGYRTRQPWQTCPNVETRKIRKFRTLEKSDFKTRKTQSSDPYSQGKTYTNKTRKRTLKEDYTRKIKRAPRHPRKGLGSRSILARRIAYSQGSDYPPSSQVILGHPYSQVDEIQEMLSTMFI